MRPASTAPEEGSQEVMRLVTARLPRAGGACALNLLYTLGFMRIAGQLEGAAAVDRAGGGQVHRSPDRRAADTMAHLTGWIQHGPESDEARASLARVRRMHEHYARDYAMSNETFVHTIAWFTLQFDILLSLVGAAGFTERERTAQLVHWRAVGEALGTRDMPESWEGMRAFLDWYERSPEWFGPSPDGFRLTGALIDQFNARWLPRRLHRLGRWVLLSLHEDHVLAAIGQPKPPRAVVATVRAAARAALSVNRRVPPDRRQLPDLSAEILGPASRQAIRARRHAPRARARRSG